MEKYAIIIKDKCIACGSCNSIAPDIFDYDDDGYSENVYNNDENKGCAPIGEDLHEDLIDAAETCPTGAIQVADTPFS